MKYFNNVLKNDLFKYLIAGILTTIFYFLTRKLIFSLSHHVITSTIFANGLAILAAFALNDIWVFAQERKGWLARLIKFFIARLSSMGIDVSLSLFLVDKFPEIIGQFVNHNIDTVDSIVALIGQVLIVITNYVISKFLIFKK
ncbi:GtrA family protein [Streptococcus sp. S784/96/1]|uniref:GtrA family protein n=1 Tax=Streptococcus sp. S784/96/1 TaxID=2653499 RepID=UPI001386DC44|nr:GtrA family protein [Streptococcus sp. S784/96/1]